MRFTKISATLTAVATTAALAVPAHAQEYNEYQNPNDQYGKFEPGEEVPAFTGSSFTDALAIMAITLPTLKLFTDNIPALRTMVDDWASRVGMAGSSGSSVDSRMNGGLDFDLARLARTNGLTQLADQLEAMQQGSSRPAEPTGN